MPEPIVTSVEIDGATHWGASDAEWVTKAQVQPVMTRTAEEDKRAASVPADGDGPDPKTSKR